MMLNKGTSPFALGLLVLSALVFSCSKNDQQPTPKGNFFWKDELTLSDIPNHPVKGFLNGTEVQFQYINFERWRGSGDNVLNFSLSNPQQPCGYVEEFVGVRLISKSKPVDIGEWSKPNFSSPDDAHLARLFYKAPDGTIYAPDFAWNCILLVDKIQEKTVQGRIALCFNDPLKSWLAGSFSALICNN